MVEKMVGQLAGHRLKGDTVEAGDRVQRKRLQLFGYIQAAIGRGTGQQRFPECGGRRLTACADKTH